MKKIDLGLDLLSSIMLPLTCVRSISEPMICHSYVLTSQIIYTVPTFAISHETVLKKFTFLDNKNSILGNTLGSNKFCRK